MGTEQQFKKRIRVYLKDHPGVPYQEARQRLEHERLQAVRDELLRGSLPHGCAHVLWALTYLLDGLWHSSSEFFDMVPIEVLQRDYPKGWIQDASTSSNDTVFGILDKVRNGRLGSIRLFERTAPDCDGTFLVRLELEPNKHEERVALLHRVVQKYKATEHRYTRGSALEAYHKWVSSIPKPQPDRCLDGLTGYGRMFVEAISGLVRTTNLTDSEFEKKLLEILRSCQEDHHE